MPLISACCCWEKLEDGSRASAWFTGVTAVINLIIDIWLLVQLHWLTDNLEKNEQINFLPPGILVFIYLELIWNLVLLGLAFVLMIGINRQHEGYRFIYGWVWGVGLHRAYELFLGVYTLAWLGAHRISDVIFIAHNFIFVIVYWFLNCVILAVAIICVMSYWTELMDEVYGKFRRVKYLTMLANIRNAALSSRSVFSGTATPRSMYSRSVASTLHMAPSQMSLGGGRAFQTGNPYSRPGQAQPGYPQPGYPQPGHPQPGYPQPQPGYPQPQPPPQQQAQHPHAYQGPMRGVPPKY